MKKYIYLPPHFFLSPSQQEGFFKAGLTLVYADTIRRKVHVCDGYTCTSSSQDTREATRQRADIYLSPQFICYLDDKLTASSSDFLSKGLLNLLIS